MPRGWLRAIVVCVGTTAAGSALAQSATSVRDPSVPTFANTFALEGGVLGFVDAGSHPTDVRAATWSVRYGYSPATTVTWELAYTGAMDVSQGAADTDHLFVTLAEAGLRVNLFPLTNVYPFLGAGVGWGAFERTGGANPRSRIDASTATLPLSAGVEILAGETSLQTRLVYRPTYSDDDIPFTATGADSWSWTASLGARF